MLKCYKNLYIFTGPMFSGKTTSLINCYKNSKFRTQEKISFKYAEDKRYETIDKTNFREQNNNVEEITRLNKKQNNIEGNIITHNKNRINALYIQSCKDINKYISDNIKEIYIDEGQFFKDIFKWYNIVNNSINNIENIYISGLNLDYKGNTFNEEFNKLLQLKSPNINIHYLTGKCYKCNKESEYSILINKNLNTNDKNNIIIGGNETFQPCCKEHVNF